MIVTAFKFALAAAVIVASVTVPFAIRHRAQAQWQADAQLISLQTQRLAELSAQRQRLSNQVAQAENPTFSNEQFRELLRLRGEIGPLRRAAGELENLRAENRLLVSAGGRADFQPQPASQPVPQTFQAYWPKNELAFAGYADPAAALQTALWSMSRGNPAALAASVTPEAGSRLTREEWYNHGPPAEELALATKRIAESLAPDTGFYLVAQDSISENEASLNLYFAGEGKTRQVTMKKIGPEWKFDTLGNAWP